MRNGYGASIRSPAHKLALQDAALDAANIHSKQKTCCGKHGYQETSTRLQLAGCFAGGQHVAMADRICSHCGPGCSASPLLAASNTMSCKGMIIGIGHSFPTTHGLGRG